ncbi:Gti1/Pac2 family-domain-containing protein [Hygrophoropsis aurantiaca]|uniref:Gti1/Pac2 family-domain-containing protein n=1 Tax=Hygrophoropsis aurantiaca TaxID=72124 RepID=A0ACB8A0M7_9AGAM|nr:Gti1/Pac2 family-domain-containing protein [Hygrophoropsis aurantiaca]
MSANQQISASGSGGNQSPSATWTEPPWSGWIETTGDALLILEAARRGLIPRVTRRLVDSERKMITSGSVFVFDEDESGIKRWTDGFFWSPSRILGNFLLYRETDKRGAGHRGVRSDPASDLNEHSQYNVDGVRLEGQTLSRPKGDSSSLGVDRHRERVLVGSLTNSYKFKSDGLMKKTFSLTIGGVSQHLISYYKVEDVEQGRLRSPSSLPELASLDISPEYLDKTHFRNPPKVEIGVDGVPRYRGEADDIDTAPSLLSAPLSSGLPLLTDGRVSEGKRGARYAPYGSAGGKRSRKGKGIQRDSASPTEQHPPLPSPSTSTGSHPPPPPPPGYADPASMSSMPSHAHAHYPPYHVPNYYGVPGYPVAPPPVYSAPPYSNPSPTTPHQTSPTPPQPYAYSSYSTPPSASEPPQQGMVPQQPPHQQQGFFPYYPPPPPHAPYDQSPLWNSCYARP